VEAKELTNLKCLRLSENQFSIFPNEIFLLESLERLYLDKMKELNSPVCQKTPANCR